METVRREARSAREQEDKTGSGGKNREHPEGVDDFLRSRTGLTSVAEGAQRDREEAWSAREQEDKAGSGAKNREHPEGVDDFLRSRTGLTSVAEGAQRDKMSKTKRDITVVHPVYGRVTVTAARDKLDAITEAARRWGAQWSKLVAECTFEEARSAREQEDKTGSGAKNREHPEGVDDFLRSRTGLTSVAEGAQRDREEARSAREEGGRQI